MLLDHLGRCWGHLLKFIKWKEGQDLGARKQKEALETYSSALDEEAKRRSQVAVSLRVWGSGLE